MDVISIDKTGENFRLIYDTKGRFAVHRITPEEAKYKLCKVRKIFVGTKGIPHLVTHDARTIRYPDPLIKVLGFPNPLAENIILEAHLIHFANCSLVQPTFSDPPEDVLLAMIIAPICLIPFLVTLVVWRSKDSDAQDIT
ncbi:hypothetical protein, partial [Lactiplantibacillus plantarum]|uniref:hypothetical protein n=1 Tax=Lactiplantibacillus plantarum TaxID=1590 RepID=UPI00374E3CC4